MRWFIGLMLLSGGAAAQTASITDGDTIRLGNTNWRLRGIDAPERHQACADGWAAGQAASDALRAMMKGQVKCELRDHDRYGCSVGLCRVDGKDLGAAMVNAGMAWAFTRYSSDYVGEERRALASRVGVHAHDCTKPWDWRAQRRPQ